MMRRWASFRARMPLGDPSPSGCGAVCGEAFGAAVIVSADLAQTHWANTTFGANPNAKDFDYACGRWATTLDDGIFSVQESVVDSIKSSGWLGLPFLHGALATTAGGSQWHGALLSKPCAPTYYGMMVATFDRDDRMF